MINIFNQILSYNNFWGNPAKNYFIALLIFLSAVICLKIFKKILVNRVKKIADHSQVDFFNLIIKIINFVKLPFYILFSLYLSFQFLDLSIIIDKLVSYGLIILTIYYFVKAGQELIDYGARKMIKTQEAKEEGKFDPTVIYILSKTLKVILWILAVIIILQALGYDITALVAGLGIGGVAIAFALQGILSDIFASFSIYFDRPFKIGDYIVVGDDSGTVKSIGIKSTRIQTLKGEELVISNKQLTEARIHNYKKMKKRRNAFALEIVYNTPTEKLKKIPLIIKEIIAKFELVELDRVHFKKFGEFSLSFEIVYYLNSADYKQHMDIQQKINLGIKEAFEKENIEFAFPTQKIFLNK
jgi:small-conductance mechanosensitive channel